MSRESSRSPSSRPKTITGLETKTIQGVQPITGVDILTDVEYRREFRGLTGQDSTGDPVLDRKIIVDYMARANEEEGKRRRRRGPRIRLPSDGDVRPVEAGQLGGDAYPRQVVHEEVILDVPQGGGEVDRVLVDVSDPRVATVDDTPPPSGEHIAGSQRIYVQGKSVTGESVAPMLPPRDAAAQHPEGQVEEAVFITDVDTGKTTVHRFREAREPGETLEGQLERVSEEQRPVTTTKADGNLSSSRDGAAPRTGGQATRHAPTMQDALIDLAKGRRGGEARRRRREAASREFTPEQLARSRAIQKAAGIDTSMAAQKNRPKSRRRRSGLREKDLKQPPRGKIIIIR